MTAGGMSNRKIHCHTVSVLMKKLVTDVIAFHSAVIVPTRVDGGSG